MWLPNLFKELWPFEIPFNMIQNSHSLENISMSMKLT